MNHATPELASELSIDPENPWLGLSSYSEETRAYFHGRDEEAAELARRVQRKLLTVLFGQSGLGKTSLLQAGLVPRLRDEGFCPVYVRVDYSPDSPPPSEQIKQAIFRATAAAGHWSRPGSSIEGESLWEFLHHRGDLLRDAEGRTLLPLLIFDQFEEIFTLAQADDAGRLRAKLFLEDLADLVENRAPEALEQRLEKDEADAEQFDFARADYRILIALREDYLAHLESVKSIMPSITQNRMRLARMTGAQALSAVLKPGGRLVSAEVAESIVRFVAGGSELANAEVEPSLLSLVCRELNTARLAQDRAEISADLLAGSRDTILKEFYERALADQPEGVRRVIEDELLTDSGYRESLAEERVQKALAAAGAAPDALARLVDRRLLRIEERLDMRRVELTHDVLCSVVRSSRDLRHEREAREEARRQLQIQQEREAATRRSLLRARAVAAVSAVLMLVAGASAVFGWVNFNRARVADAQAQEARLLADQARGDAERLVGFLIEDFYTELEPTGRLETMASLAHMAVEYYEGLPAGLVTPRTEFYRAMALLREGEALYASGEIARANANIETARGLFEKLRTGGSHAEDATIGLALALFTRYKGTRVGALVAAPELQQAAELLRPMTEAPDGPRRARLLYAEVLNYLSHTQPLELGVQTCEEARRILVELGALDLSDLGAASVYADTSDSQARHALGLGRVEEAEQLSIKVYDLAERVLAQRPGDLRAMQNRALAADMLGTLADRRHDYAAAAKYAAMSERAGHDLLRFNPTDLESWVYWIRGKESVSNTLFEQGEVLASIEVRRSIVNGDAAGGTPPSVMPVGWAWGWLAAMEAEMGRREPAEDAWEAANRSFGEALSTLPADSPLHAVNAARREAARARLLLTLGDEPGALRHARAAEEQVGRLQLREDDVNTLNFSHGILRHALATDAISNLRLGRHAEAEAASRRWLEVPRLQARGDDPQDSIARNHVRLAHAIALQGRKDEALALLQPELERYRHEASQGAAGITFQRDLAHALYVDALAQADDEAGAASRQALLVEAAQILADMTTEARQLGFVRELGGLIAAASR